MNFKIAAMLIVSVFMSANTSYGGDLLDRMLGRAGCSSCAAPAAESCGCGGGGLLEKLMSGCGNKCNAADILNVDSDAGCGCQAAAPSCGCDAAPAAAASPCGCDGATVLETSPCGCDAAPVAEASPCGCDAAPAVAASPCGCDAAPAGESDGLFARLRAMGSGCGCNAAPAAPPCGCDAAPAAAASPCGCDAAPAGGSDGLFARIGAMRGGGCGCDAAPAAPAVAASPCGCDAAPAAAASPCGCDAAPANGEAIGLIPLLMEKRNGGCGCNSAPAAAASPCGCDAAPAVAAASPCGCDAAPAVESISAFEASPAMASPFACDAAPAEGGCGSGGGFLSRLRGMGKGLSCNSAPAAAEASACGCDAAPVAQASPCGCDAAPAVSTCGCNAGPAAVSTCGCEAPSGACKSGGGLGGGSYRPGATRPKLTLLDRLKGNRVARDRDGRVIGVCNDGCNPPCPQEPSPCGCGAHAEAPYVIEAAPCSSCSTCGGGEVIYSDAMPVNGCANGLCGSTPIYGEAVALPAAAAAVSDDSEGSGSRVDPVVPAATEGTLQDVEEIERRDVTQPSVSDEENDPIVDPGAFITRPTNTFGS